MYWPRKNRLVFQFFSWYIHYIIKKDFSAFSFNIPTEIKKEEAILLLANHFSWWDGFLLFQLNKVLFKKQFHVLVTAENYRNIGFLKYLGAFAAENKGKDVMETLNYAGALLDNPENLVLIFPQGKIYSNHTSRVKFEKGIMQVVNASQKRFQFVFASTLTDYFSRRKPTVTTNLMVWESEEYMSLQLLKSTYNKHYEDTVLKQSQIAV